MAIYKVKTKNPQISKWEVYVPVDGRGSKRIRRRFDRKTDAEKFLENFQTNLDQQKLSGISFHDFEKTTFRTEAEYWFEAKKRSFSPGTVFRTKSILFSELLPKYGEIPAIKMNLSLVTKIQNDLLKRGKAPLTVNRIVGVVKAILNFSAAHQRLPLHPALHAKPVSAVQKQMLFWEPDEAARFLRYASDKYPEESGRRWIYIVYLLALNTGMRSGEIWGLKPSDIQQNRDLIHVSRQYDYAAKGLRPCKGRSERYVPCHPMLKRELQNWIARIGKSTDDLVFNGRSGMPVEDHSFKRHHFRQDMKLAEVRKIRFHDLRHTAATLMIANGVMVPTVQAILDHKDISTTMRYVHLIGDSIQKVAAGFVVKPQVEKISILPLLS